MAPKGFIFPEGSLEFLFDCGSAVSKAEILDFLKSAQVSEAFPKLIPWEIYCEMSSLLFEEILVISDRHTDAMIPEEKVVRLHLLALALNLRFFARYSSKIPAEQIVYVAYDVSVLLEFFRKFYQGVFKANYEAQIEKELFVR